MNPKDKIEKNKNASNKNVSNTKNKEASYNQKNNVESLKVIEELKQKIKDVEDKLLRSLAENDNLRKDMKKKQRII